MAPRTEVVGRTVVITGAASGIGRALAVNLSAQGCPVAMVDWNEEGLQETATMLQGPYLSRKLDVRDRNAWLVFASEVKDWAPASIGLVVNNAGVTVTQPVSGASVEDDEWVMDVNFGGVVNGTRAFLPIIQAQPEGGAIANVSSIFGFMGWPNQSAYCASKGAVKGFTEALRHELHNTHPNVAVACIHPGGIKTNIVRNARFHEDDLGRTDRSVMEKEFEMVTFTTAERAAQTIQKGVEKGKARILIGPDAYFISALTRALPERYFNVIRFAQPFLRK